MARRFSDPETIALTGASGGIGAALAEIYARPGVRLALAGRDHDRLAAVAERCRDRGAAVETSAFDIADAAAACAWMRDVDGRRPVDLLIANAGISSGIGPDGKAESWETVAQVLQVNAIGALVVAQVMAERMAARRCGQIALMSSLAAYRGLPSCPAYSASKAAVKAYGEGLRGWLRPQGVGVSVVCPGYVVSPMSARVVGPKPFLMPAEAAARLIRRRLARDAAVIAFPFPLAFGTRLLALLPGWAAARILPFFDFRVRAATLPGSPDSPIGGE